MPSVEIKKQQLNVGMKSVPLLSGEMHYWRLKPAAWKTCLASVRKMGINIISTYVPWFYHEYERGKFDFTGKTDPCRNLRGFLDLLKKNKFWVIIRPGPYIYSESPNDGVPDYAYKYHRLHPKFLEYAFTYMKNVCRLIKNYQATRAGGHIILLQADNEIDPWPDVFGHQYGFGDKPGLFQDFIRIKYNNSINALNEAWGVEYKRFDETGPYIVHHLKGDTGLRRHLDYYEFKHFYSLQVAKWVIAQYKKLGITVPIYLNLYPFFYAHDWAKMQEVSDMTGIDLYPENELAVDENDHRKLMDKIRYTRTYSTVSYIAEFAAGVWHYRHYESGVLSPNHYRLITLSALAAGVCGWNWYMLVNRDNWYMSPINEWGQPRQELFSVFQDLVKIFHIVKPYACQKVTDVAVTFNPLQYAAKTVPQNGFIISSLYEADIDYESFDCTKSTLEKKVLFYSGNQWLDRKGQENLLDYVTGGGVLVCFRNYPRRDDNFRKLNLLGFVDPSKVLFEFKKECLINLPGGKKVKTVSSIYSFNNVPGKKIYASIEGWGKYVVGYEKKLGRGRIIHIGVEPSTAILFSILRYLNINLYTYSKTQHIKTVLFKRGKKYFLVVVNNGGEDKSATIIITHKDFVGKRYYIRDIENNKKEIKAPSKKPLLHVPVLRKNGKVLELGIIR